MCVGRNAPSLGVKVFPYANFTEINETPLILIFFFERSSHDAWRFYGYVERKASQTRRDDFAAIFANRHVRFIPAEGDAKVFREGLSCAWRTDTARTALWLSPSLSLSLSRFLNRISSLDISGFPWCPGHVDLASGMCATGMRRVYVLSRVASLFRLSRLRERISGTLVYRGRGITPPLATWK